MFKQPHADFYQIVETEEFLPPIGLWTICGGLFLSSTLIGAIALAAFTQYPITVKAAATIRPDGELRVVQAAIEGTVKSIEVKPNQAVKAGDTIAYLDDSRSQTKKNQLQASLEESQQQITQITSQISAYDRQIIAENERVNRTVAGTQADLNRTQRDYQNQEITSKAQVAEAEANLRQASQELQKNDANLKSALANLKSAETGLRAAKVKRDRYLPLMKSGAISQLQFEEAQLAAEQEEQTVIARQAAVQGEKHAVDRQKQAVVAEMAKLEAAKSALNPSDAVVASARETIAREKAAGEVALARSKQERQQLIQRQVELENKLNRDRQEMQQLTKELKYTALRSPASGIIQKLNLRNISQVVRPGETVAEVSPTQAPLVISVRVASGDISKVQKGQKVQMRVSACPYPDYGTLNGTVSAISPDAIAQTDAAQTNSQSLSPAGGFYQVKIEPEILKLNAGRGGCEIVMGMEGTVDIIAKNESVLTFILRKARLLTDL
jgi:multidrug efflux pump subunit AcrA (membrane-fusion protein)